MGTHPIFESDFDCLTDNRHHVGDFAPPNPRIFCRGEPE